MSTNVRENYLQCFDNVLFSTLPTSEYHVAFWGSRNQIMVFVTTELFNPIQHTCSVFIVVVVVVLFYFAYQTHCFFVVVIAVTVVAVLSLI